MFIQGHDDVACPLPAWPSKTQGRILEPSPARPKRSAGIHRRNGNRDDETEVPKENDDHVRITLCSGPDVSRVRSNVRSSVRCVAVIGVVVCMACGEMQSSSTTGVRDSAGVRIVENGSPQWRPGDEWRLSAEPVVDIGSVSAGEEYELFQVWSPVRLSNGSIVVVNGGSQELRFYDADGRFVRAAGRRGGGPGEFENVRWMHRMPGDSLITYDFRHIRFAVFDSSGTFARGVRLVTTSEVPFATIVDMFGDGSFLAQGFANTGGETPSGLQRYRAPLYHFGADGTFLTELGMFGGNEVYFVASPSGGFRSYNAFFPLYTYRRAAGDRLYIAANDTYELRKQSLDGTLTDLMRVTGAPISVTSDHVDMEIERRLNDAGSEEEREALAKTLRQIPVPETFPAYEKVEIDEEGNVWVHEFTKPGDAQATWAVFDSTGILLGRLTAPLRFEPHDIGSDYMVGIWRDDEGVEHVQLYNIIKP